MLTTTFKQGEAICDYVFPLCLVKELSIEQWQFERFLGTAFVIGNKGFALTAAHVLPKAGAERVVAIFVSHKEGWWATRITTYEIHSVEDVAIVRLAGSPWKSFFRLSNTWEGSSARYQMWGYPEDVAEELEENGRVITRPDLVYAEGYIRRRISGHSFPGIRGRQFFELSELVGCGCSGSPIYVNRRPFWDVIGIYIGERRSNRSTGVAYGVREDAFRNWSPSCLESSVLIEASNVAVV